MRLTTILPFALLSTLTAVAQSQSNPPRGVPEPVPPFLQRQHPTAPGPTALPEPSTPPARQFRDSRYGVSFMVPAAWHLTRKDFEVSTFHLDARNVPRNAQLRAVATISFNPHPTSTFSGALFYFSVAPHTTASQCAAQASARLPHTMTTTQVGGLTFTHGYDEHGGICTESRDEIYTSPRNGACYRFDVVINNFCGGDVSGVREITERELDSVRHRMQAILDSVRFVPR